MANVTGINDVLRNLNRAIADIEGDTFDGVKAAGLFVKGESIERTPVEFSVLRNSAFTQAERRGAKSVSKVGYTAKYAPFVHEAPMKLSGQPRKSGRGVYWQGGENKFLEKAVKFNTAEILRIIRDRARV